jgi:hypothetical protein
MDLSGYYFIDGKDLWTAYSVFVESGSDDFLKYPAKKESITHDWMDTNGIDVDLSRQFFDAREITLRCAIVVTSTSEFWQKYNGLIADLTQPGTRRFSIGEFGSRSYYLHYKECNSFDRFTRVKDGTTNKIAMKFTLVLVEPNPTLDNGDVFLWDEDGRFIVT